MMSEAKHDATTSPIQPLVQPQDADWQVAPPPAVQPAALLPCPFCGDVDHLRVVQSRYGDRVVNTPYVSCFQCAAEGPICWGGGKSDAVDAWNRRAGQPTSDADGLRLEAAG